MRKELSDPHQPTTLTKGDSTKENTPTATAIRQSSTETVSNRCYAEMLPQTRH